MGQKQTKGKKMNNLATVLWNAEHWGEYVVSYIKVTTGKVTLYDPKTDEWTDTNLSEIREIIFPLPE